jgi:hypothetical protein
MFGSPSLLKKRPQHQQQPLLEAIAEMTSSARESSPSSPTSFFANLSVDDGSKTNNNGSGKKPSAAGGGGGKCTRIGRNWTRNSYRRAQRQQLPSDTASTAKGLLTNEKNVEEDEEENEANEDTNLESVEEAKDIRKNVSEM